MLHVKGEGLVWLVQALARLRERADFNVLGVPDLLNDLVAAARPVRVWYVHGHWLDVNSVRDLESARAFAAG
jgi:phosphoenolpyruvate phosphomutase